MKNALIIVAALLTLSGCSREPETRVIERIDAVCTNETKNDRSEFILQCIANANPNSDEEPEDWITLCNDMAEITYCEKKSVTVEQWRPGPGAFWHDTKVKEQTP